MFKLIVLAAIIWLANLTGNLPWVVVAYVAWEFLKGAMGGGGIAGGIQAVVLKCFFAGLIIVALESDYFHGSTAWLVGLIGALGLLVGNLPTFKKNAAAAAAARTNDAEKALKDSLAKGGDSSGAHQRVAESAESSGKAGGSGNSGGSGRKAGGKNAQAGKRKQGFISWFFLGPNPGAGKR
jgi:hypothetical protein